MDPEPGHRPYGCRRTTDQTVHRRWQRIEVNQRIDLPGATEGHTRRSFLNEVNNNTLLIGANAVAMDEVDLNIGTIDTIYPRLYLDLPESTPVDIELSKEESAVENPLVGDLVIFYAFDKGDFFQIVSNSDLKELDISKEDIHEHSIKNLRNLNLEIRANGTDTLLMLSAGGDYEATLALLPEVWDSVGEMIKGDILISIPARDVLLVTGSETDNGIAELTKRTKLIVETADKPLSKNIYKRAEGKWTQFK